jgi:DNA-binding transcriptional LysR family regulator
MANAHFFCFDALQAPAMNFTWLEDFLALAATGNFSRAAQDRHVTQPAFSRRVRALEEWLGVDLFDRSGQPARLTPAGVWFEDMARELLARVDRLPARRAGWPRKMSPPFALPAPMPCRSPFCPPGCVAWKVAHRLGRCSSCRTCCRAVKHCCSSARCTSFWPTAMPPYRGRWTRQPARSRWWAPTACCPSARQTAPASHCTHWTGAAPCRCWPTVPSRDLGRILAAVHGDALGRVPGQAVFTAHLASVLKTMALDGRGVAWLPAMLISDALAAGQLVEAGTPRWRVDLEVRLLRDPQPLAQAAERFWLAATSPSP